MVRGSLLLAESMSGILQNRQAKGDYLYLFLFIARYCQARYKCLVHVSIVEIARGLP